MGLLFSDGEMGLMIVAAAGWIWAGDIVRWLMGVGIVRRSWILLLAWSETTPLDAAVRRRPSLLATMFDEDDVGIGISVLSSSF
ncbi:hypothetical protein ACLOJK_029855 [Asimina triloba]